MASRGRSMTSDQSAAASKGPRPDRPRRWWPLALLLLVALLGHDLLMTRVAAAHQPVTPSTAHASTHHTAHHAHGESIPPTAHGAGSDEGRPEPRHILGCGAGPRAVTVQTGDDPRSAPSSLARPATVPVLRSTPQVEADYPPPIAPSAVRRALLQVFLI